MMGYCGLRLEDFSAILDEMDQQDCCLVATWCQRLGSYGYDAFLSDVTSKSSMNMYGLFFSFFDYIPRGKEGKFWRLGPDLALSTLYL